MQFLDAYFFYVLNCNCWNIALVNIMVADDVIAVSR